jgi:hypothetical protein
MQNSRSAHYSALPGQSRSAYHASKSAWLFDWFDFQAQHSELRSKVFVGPLVNLTRAAGRQVSDSFLRTADIAECVTAKRSFDLSHAGVHVVVRNPVGRRGTARLGREDSNLRMAESKSAALAFIGRALISCTILKYKGIFKFTGHA